MEKEKLILMAQLLTGIKDALNTLEEAKKKEDYESMVSAKKELLYFQTEIKKLL